MDSVLLICFLGIAASGSPITFGTASLLQFVGILWRNNLGDLHPKLRTLIGVSPWLVIACAFVVFSDALIWTLFGLAGVSVLAMAVATAQEPQARLFATHFEIVTPYLRTFRYSYDDLEGASLARYSILKMRLKNGTQRSAKLACDQETATRLVEVIRDRAAILVVIPLT